MITRVDSSRRPDPRFEEYEHRAVAWRPHLAQEIRELHEPQGDPDPLLMRQLVGHLLPWARPLAQGR